MSLPRLPNDLSSFSLYAGDEPFENHAGPFMMYIDPDGGPHLSAFQSEKRHTNGLGVLHGGLLMAFADYALFVIAHDLIVDTPCVTISCQTDFIRGAEAGGLIFAHGNVTRSTRSLVFIRGLVCDSSHETLASFSGIIKRVGR